MSQDDQPVATARSLRLDPYCSQRPRFLALPDANALLSSVDNDCRHDRRSRLLRMTDGNAAALYAPDHVYLEVYEKFPRMARFSPAPADVLRARFEEEYLPAMRFVTVSPTPIVDPQVLAITDPDDVPLGQLAKLVAPCIVFSEDKHLRRPGLAPADWRLAAKFGTDVVEGSEAQQGTGVVAIAPGWASVELIRFLGRRSGVSPWLLGAAALGGLAYVLRRPERREAAGKYIVPVIEGLGQMLEEARVQQEQGLAGLREVILPPPVGPTVRQQVAIVLARQQEPLLASEVQDLIQEHFPDETVPTVSEVRRTLADGTEFVQPERYRWQFGRDAASWRPE